MSYRAIFFDLDGTLLPLDQELFSKVYFKELSGVLAPLGTTPEVVIATVWGGTKAMVKNTGELSNADVFWKYFSQNCPLDADVCRPLCDTFYTNEFHRARQSARENPLAVTAVELAREKSGTVVLATNPIFPLVAQRSRLSWIGLDTTDFDLVTSYESDSFCKPNPQYFIDICRRIGVAPEECLMIGNDELEDMYAASSIGMSCYLVTDCLLPCAEHPWVGPRGTFSDMVDMLRNL